MELNNDLEYFFKKRSIQLNDIINHDCFKDLEILIEIRKQYWKDLTKSEQAYWGAIWGSVYHYHNELVEKHLEKFTSIIESFQTPERKKQVAFRIIREIKKNCNAV